MSAPGQSGHRSGGVAKYAASQLASRKTGSRLTWSDPPFGDASIGIGEGAHVHAHATLSLGVASLRTASVNSITHVI